MVKIKGCTAQDLNYAFHLDDLNADQIASLEWQI